LQQTIERSVMERDVGEMTDAELRREAATLRAWIRDVKAPKSARLREISAEIEHRKPEKRRGSRRCGSSGSS
jgi:hypothetical protein